MISTVDGDSERGAFGMTSSTGVSISSVGTSPRSRMPASSRSYSSCHRAQPSDLIMNFMRLRCLCW